MGRRWSDFSTLCCPKITVSGSQDDMLAAASIIGNSWCYSVSKSWGWSFSLSVAASLGRNKVSPLKDDDAGSLQTEHCSQLLGWKREYWCWLRWCKNGKREIPQSPRMTLVSELSDLGLVQKALNSTAYHCILKPSIILKQQRYTEKGER